MFLVFDEPKIREKKPDEEEVVLLVVALGTLELRFLLGVVLELPAVMLSF